MVWPLLARLYSTRLLSFRGRSCGAVVGVGPRLLGAEGCGGELESDRTFDRTVERRRNTVPSFVQGLLGSLTPLAGKPCSREHPLRRLVILPRLSVCMEPPIPRRLPEAPAELLTALTALTALTVPGASVASLPDDAWLGVGLGSVKPLRLVLGLELRLGLGLGLGLDRCSWVVVGDGLDSGSAWSGSASSGLSSVGLVMSGLVLTVAW